MDARRGIPSRYIIILRNRGWDDYLSNARGNKGREKEWRETVRGEWKSFLFPFRFVSTNKRFRLGPESIRSDEGRADRRESEITLSSSNLPLN